MRFILLILSMSVVAAIPNPPKTLGCAIAPHDRERVAVNVEEAIIVYDAATRTEHFIRRASFRTTAKDFGFLVPTPTQPRLAEIDSSAFATLRDATAPRRVFSGKVERIELERPKGNVDGRAKSAPPSRAPEILERKKVAGYDAVVLRADDHEGLKTWLEENRYDARPAIVDWLKWYVENKWIITAFKVASDDASRDRWAKSVRMSFETDAPFYPYREPEDMRTRDPTDMVMHPRLLRVYFLANVRYQGKLGSDGAWAGDTVWSNVCPAEALNRIVASFAMGTKAWHLTEFEDSSSPRPGTNEVFFRRAEDQRTVERPVIYYDDFEYFYKDEPPAAGGKFPFGGYNLLYVGLILGGVAAIISAVIVLRKSRSDGGKT